MISVIIQADNYRSHFDDVAHEVLNERHNTVLKRGVRAPLDVFLYDFDRTSKVFILYTSEELFDFASNPEIAGGLFVERNLDISYEFFDEVSHFAFMMRFGPHLGRSSSTFLGRTLSKRLGPAVLR